jgi:NADH:ubiquinone oxidoreductase subunit 4 (subunit M)
MEMIPVAVLIVAIIAVGVYPAFISDIFTIGLEPLVESLGNAAMASAGIR